MIRRASGGVLAASLVAWTVVWFASPLSDFLRVSLLDILWAIAFAAAGLAAWTSARGPSARAFRLLGAGALLSAIGQAVWCWYDLHGDPVPSPSLADVAYGLAVPLFAAALVTWPRSKSGGRVGDVFDGSILVVVVFLIGWEFVISPVAGDDLHLDDMTGLAYPVIDLLLLGGVLFGVTIGRWSEPARLFALAGAITAAIATDAHVAVTGDSFQTGASAFDFGWTIAIALFGVAAFIPAGTRHRIPTALVPIGAVVVLVAIRFYQLGEIAPQIPTVDMIDLVVSSLVLAALALRYVFAAGSRLVESKRRTELHEQLERAYAQREAALEASRTGVCLFDPDGELVFYNPAWSRLLGPESSLGPQWREFVGSLILDMAALADVGERPAVRFRADDKRHLLASATALDDGHVVVSVDDVTDEELERGVRDRFLASMVGAQDHEARRIAEVLHDDVVQRLTALSLRLELRSVNESDVTLEGLAAEASAITGSIRRLLIDLHPAVLESQGLAAAVDAAAGGLRELGVKVTVERLERRLPQEIEQLAYRLIQEAFANAIKHADATQVKVAFSTTSKRLFCRVVDDGRGFVPQETSGAVRRGSIGLLLVRERIELAGGRFLLESRPDRGTVFGFELPLARKSSPDEVAEAAS